MTFLSALILGLLAGAHCAGMCGGWQMAMQAGGPQEATLRSRKEALVHLLLMNFGRIITYFLAGVLFTYIGYATLNGLNITNSARWLRVATGVVIFLIGLQILLGQNRSFRFVEPLGAAVWRPVSKLIKHTSNRKSQSLITGLLYKRLKQAISNRSFQRVGGLFFMLGGSLILSAPYWVNKAFMVDYPELLSLAFCVT